MENEKKWARQCDITEEGMNQGWVWYDGTFYSKYEKDTVAELHKDFDEEWGSKEWTDEEILNKAYESDVCYWTEWEDPDDRQFVERADGTIAWYEMWLKHPLLEEQKTQVK